MNGASQSYMTGQMNDAPSRNATSDLQISFSTFLNDYDMIENKGLGAGTHEAFITDRFALQSMRMRFNE